MTIIDTGFSRSVIDRHRLDHGYGIAGAPLVFLDPELDSQQREENMGGELCLALKLLLQLNLYHHLPLQQNDSARSGAIPALQMQLRTAMQSLRAQEYRLYKSVERVAERVRVLSVPDRSPKAKHRKAAEKLRSRAQEELSEQLAAALEWSEQARNAATAQKEITVRMKRLETEVWSLGGSREAQVSQKDAPPREAPPTTLHGVQTGPPRQAAARRRQNSAGPIPCIAWDVPEALRRTETVIIAPGAERLPPLGSAAPPRSGSLQLLGGGMAEPTPERMGRPGAMGEPGSALVWREWLDQPGRPDRPDRPDGWNRPEPKGIPGTPETPGTPRGADTSDASKTSETSGAVDTAAKAGTLGVSNAPSVPTAPTAPVAPGANGARESLDESGVHRRPSAVEESLLPPGGGMGEGTTGMAAEWGERAPADSARRFALLEALPTAPEPWLPNQRWGGTEPPLASTAYFFALSASRETGTIHWRSHAIPLVAAEKSEAEQTKRGIPQRGQARPVRESLGSRREHGAAEKSWTAHFGEITRFLRDKHMEMTSVLPILEAPAFLQVLQPADRAGNTAPRPAPLYERQGRGETLYRNAPAPDGQRQWGPDPSPAEGQVAGRTGGIGPTSPVGPTGPATLHPGGGSTVLWFEGRTIDLPASGQDISHRQIPLPGSARGILERQATASTGAGVAAGRLAHPSVLSRVFERLLTRTIVQRSAAVEPAALLGETWVERRPASGRGNPAQSVFHRLLQSPRTPIPPPREGREIGRVSPAGAAAAVIAGTPAAPAAPVAPPRPPSRAAARPRRGDSGLRAALAGQAAPMGAMGAEVLFAPSPSEAAGLLAYLHYRDRWVEARRSALEATGLPAAERPVPPGRMARPATQGSGVLADSAPAYEGRGLQWPAAVETAAQIAQEREPAAWMFPELGAPTYWLAETPPGTVLPQGRGNSGYIREQPSPSAQHSPGEASGSGTARPAAGLPLRSSLMERAIHWRTAHLSTIWKDWLESTRSASQKESPRQGAAPARRFPPAAKAASRETERRVRLRETPKAPEARETQKNLELDKAWYPVLTTALTERERQSAPLYLREVALVGEIALSPGVDVDPRLGRPAERMVAHREEPGRRMREAAQRQTDALLSVRLIDDFAARREQRLSAQGVWMPGADGTPRLVDRHSGRSMDLAEPGQAPVERPRDRAATTATSVPEQPAALTAPVIVPAAAVSGSPVRSSGGQGPETRRPAPQIEFLDQRQEQARRELERQKQAMTSLQSTVEVQAKMVGDIQERLKKPILDQVDVKALTRTVMERMGKQLHLERQKRGLG